MKVKHIYSAALLSLLAVSCTNDDFTSMGNGALEGKKMDATNFMLVDASGNDEAQTRVDYIPGYFGGGRQIQFITPTWETTDEIGFSHIYPSDGDERLVTNYRFAIDPEDAGKTTGARFTTDNSTIFEGDYFVYYPFNDKYADYDGIPFELSNIQIQDASDEAVVDMSMDPKADASLLDKFRKAGEHLQDNKFSISNRVKAEAQVQQTEFSFNQYTSQICYLIYPTNQTNDIYIKRVELVSNTAEPLKVPTKVRFNSQGAGIDEPKAAVDEASCAEKAVLLFENVNTTSGAGGLKVPATTTSQNAVMGYISMIPATYAQGSYKFVVYYTEDATTESNSLKKVEITKSSDLVLSSNFVQPISLEINANGATEVTTGYDIYTETEFASAVIKSNAVTSGSSEFNLANDIVLNNDYTLTSKVPVTFTGDKTVTVSNGKTLTFNTTSNVNFQNTIKGEGNVTVTKGTVNIKSIDDNRLALTNAGTLVVKNAGTPGHLEYVSNSGDLTLYNADVAGAIGVHNDNGSVDLKDVTVGGYVSFADGLSTENTFENVTVKGILTNNAATLTVKGNNVLAYNAATGTCSTLTNNGTINFVEGATATIGDLEVSYGEDGYINLGRETTPSAVKVTVEGTAKLQNSLVYVDTKATFTANGELQGLKGNGHDNDLDNTTMILEGTLETANKVTYNGNFSYCGKIVNKAGGVWTVNTVAALSRFIHTHNNTQATFVNEAGGVVYVNDVHDANSTAAMNAMPKDLYDATSKGTLVWRGITTMADVDAIYKLDDNCWATDLWAELTIKNRGDSQGETLADGVDWSKKNIRLNLESESGSGTRRGYTVNVGAQKQIKAKNLTIDNQNSGQNDASSLTFAGGAENVIVVEETLKLSNSVIKPFTLTITSGATCKDLVVFNADNKFTINNGTKITYTGEYTQSGNTEDTVYPNGTPQRVD